MKKYFRFLAVIALIACVPMLISCSKYEEKGGRMYYSYWPNEAERIETEIVGYDGNSFKVLRGVFSMDALLGFDNPFAKDRNHVYYRGKIMEGADPATFKPKNIFYSTDQNSIFYEHRFLSHASPASLRILKNYYALDSDSVYWRGLAIAGANPEAFKALGKSYARDDRRGYLDGRPFEVENPAGFRVIDFLWGYDGRGYYFRGVKVEGADYATFEIVYDGYSSSSSYAKDKNRVYYCRTSGGISVGVVEGADPATFKLTGYHKSVGMDRSGYYKFGKKADRSEVEYDLGIK